jgi:hypothetical protein
MPLKLLARVTRIAALSAIAILAPCLVARAQPTSCDQLKASIPACPIQTNPCATVTNATDKANCLLLANQQHNQCLAAQQSINNAYQTCVKAKR